jgi:NTP pyrophosphatase (non-canonical NTP hydrolase)
MQLIPDGQVMHRAFKTIGAAVMSVTHRIKRLHPERTSQSLSPFSIGSHVWPGLSKLAEEAGEVMQVVGKLMGTGGAHEHWDGTNLKSRLADELADLSAAIGFVIDTCDLPAEQIEARMREKRAMFDRWHGTSG